MSLCKGFVLTESSCWGLLGLVEYIRIAEALLSLFQPTHHVCCHSDLTPIYLELKTKLHIDFPICLWLDHPVSSLNP